MQRRMDSVVSEGKEVQGDVIKSMLLSMGDNWAENLGTLQNAMNNRDQGVGR